MPDRRHTHDVFIAHASEDKVEIAKPLVAALEKRGWSAWLDELEMTVGDSLRRRIDEALHRSRFGVVILSPRFFEKEWTQRELDGLTAREVQTGSKVILPVWHEIDAEEVESFSPPLADRVGVSTDLGIDEVADQLSRALSKAEGRLRAPGKEPLVQGLSESGQRRRRAREKPGPPPPPPGPRRSYPGPRVLGIAALAGIVAFLLTALLLADTSSGTTREVNVDGASIEVPSHWRVSDAGRDDRSRGLTKQVRGPSGIILLGTVARRQLPVPAKGIASFDVRLPAGPALRSERVQALGAARMFTFRVGDRYLLLVCRPLKEIPAERIRRKCTEIARTLELSSPPAPISYPSASLRGEAQSALERYAAGRRKAGEKMQSAATPEVVANAASSAAHSAKLAAATVRSPGLATLREGLSHAEDAWRAAAEEARKEDDKAYDKAEEAVAAAEREIRRSRQQLLELGFQP